MDNETNWDPHFGGFDSDPQHHDHHTNDDVTDHMNHRQEQDHQNSNPFQSTANTSKRPSLDPTLFQSATKHNSSANKRATITSHNLEHTGVDNTGFQWSLNNGCTEDDGKSYAEEGDLRCCPTQNYFVCCNKKLNFKQTMCLIVGVVILGAVLGCGIGLAVYFGTHRS